MEVFTGKLNGVRAVLTIGALVFLLFGVVFIFFPEKFLETFPGEPLTPALNTSLAIAGTLCICWALAMVIALRNVLRSRSLVQAIILLQLIAGVRGFYYDAFVVKQTGGAAANVLVIILGLLLVVLYPWKDQT